MMLCFKKMLKVFIYKDVPESYQLGFQDSASPVMDEILFFHDQIMFLITAILVLVLYFIIRSLRTKHYHKYLFEGTLIEII